MGELRRNHGAFSADESMPIITLMKDVSLSILLRSSHLNWLVVFRHPSEKYFVRQLGWWMQPNINGKIQKMATKPPTSKLGYDTFFVFIAFFLLFCLVHFSLLFATFWSKKNLYFAEFCSKILPFALFIDFSMVLVGFSIVFIDLPKVFIIVP